MKSKILMLSIIFLLLNACSEDDESTATTPPTTTGTQSDSIVADNSSNLVSGLNGFRFETAFENTEPVAFPFLWVQYIDDYFDSVRVVTLNQNLDQTITYYLASNHRGGLTTRAFDHGSFPNNVSNSTYFSFNHPQFLLQWFVRSTGELTTTGNVFGFDTRVSKTFTGLLPQYNFEFLDRYLLRYISGVSIWPFHHQNWTDQPQFIATSELSEPTAWDHWYDESWAAWPYDVQSNMYTGFFNVTPSGNYIGIAKGTGNLDTLVLNHFPTNSYNRTFCHAYLDKSNDTLYLGLVNNVPGTLNTLEHSLYYLTITNNQLLPVYEHRSFNYSDNNVEFHKGSFYPVPLSGGFREQIDKSGTASAIPLPQTTYSMQLKFSRNKMYAVVSDNNTRKRVEIYSVPLY